MDVQEYRLKIYEKDGFHETVVPRELFTFKAIKLNDDNVKDYLDEHYPNWIRAVVILEYIGFKQRHLIDKS